MLLGWNVHFESKKDDKTLYQIKSLWLYKNTVMHIRPHGAQLIEFVFLNVIDGGKAATIDNTVVHL